MADTKHFILQPEDLQRFFSLARELLCITDKKGRFVYSNDAWKDMMGYTKEDLAKKNIMDFVHVDDVGSTVNTIKELMNQEQVGCFVNRCYAENGSARFIEWRLGLDGEYIYSIGRDITQDVTEERKKKEAIVYLNYHDRLTGLYNRAFFEEETKRLDTERQLPISLIMGDVNGLKMSNDVYGHREGDHLLQSIAYILKESCRAEDLIARWGGDEFVILLPQTPEKIADIICKRIRKACLEASTETSRLSISLGYATKTKAQEDIMNVLKKAEDFMYKRKLLESKSLRSSIIASMKKSLFEKSHETEEHAERLGKLSRKIGIVMGLTENELNELELLAMLHDIGKIAINDSILTKPAELTSEEWIEMKKHSGIGYRIAQSAPELAQIAEYILSHHERWDGAGYPQGLKGERIPLLARIISVVDAYDAMVNDRPYRRALSHHQAKTELLKNAGKQFDPQIVYVFLESVV
ncbi:HD domain-containing phosphohydrolase [Candidatus Formimonas warabiya]|uniref:Diguanylate cyclase n=1 Tax=Formimonas warabiya TaxID=1761012 RepID=A0A3G1KPB8_FORW1|nr:HD domain-containing phosphohydrolase [Candidatus Formimonas warabiya]ATW24309.1 hypothetical protein DCMF_05455 [Candidatus Formimonas warabiya]